jgi:hypothetical protein
MQETLLPELRKCPFCGGQPHYYDGGGLTGSFGIACTCGVEIAEHNVWNITKELLMQNLQTCAKRWNLRCSDNTFAEPTTGLHHN